MAFGSRSTVAQMDLAFNVDAGKTITGINEIGSVYHRTTASMSDEALRLSLAQGRLTKSVEKFGPESDAAKRATLNYRKEIASLANEENRASNSTRKLGNDVHRGSGEFSRFARGGLVGTGMLKGLGRAAAFASTSFIGGAGIVYGIRAAIDAAMNSQVVLGQTREAVEKAGLSWDTYGDKIQAAALKQANISGFDDERFLATFSSFLTLTGDVNTAIDRNALSADVARRKNIELEAAAKLVTKAELGQSGALRRLGIDAKQGATGLELIQLLTDKYAGSAERYGKSAAGAQDRFGVAIENTEEAIGKGLLPEITRMLNTGTHWLNQTKNQERIQRDVNAVVHDGAQVARGLAAGIKTITPPIKLVVGALGGLENAVQLALIAGLVLKARKAALAFGLISKASTATKTIIIANSAEEVVALEAVTAAEVEAAAAGGAGGVAGGAAGKAGKGRSIPLIGGANPYVVGAIAISTLLPGSGRANGDAYKDFPKITALVEATQQGYVPNELERKALLAFTGGKSGLSLATAPRANLAKAEAILKNQAAPYHGTDAVEAGRLAQNSGPKKSGKGAAGTGGGGSGTTLSAADKLQIGLARDPNNLGLLRQQADLDRKKIADLDAALKAGKVTSQEYTQAVTSYYSDLASTNATIQQIEDEAARKAAADQAKADRLRKARERKAHQDYLDGVKDRELALTKAVRAPATGAGGQSRHKQAEANLIGFLKKEANDEKLTNAERRGYRKKLEDERTREVKAEHDHILTLRGLQEKSLENAVKKAQLLSDPTKELAAEIKADQNLVAYYRAIEKSKESTAAEIRAAKTKELNARLAIAKLQRQSQGPSAASFFAEAASEFAQYGSNIGGAGAILSGQDARGALAQSALLDEIRQLRSEVKRGNRHSKQTAHATSTIARTRHQTIDYARDAALVGI